MANFSRLHDLYSFPGFIPAATIRGVFGDPYAVVIALRRRRKKHAVAGAAPAIAPSTTNPFDGYATSIAAAGASTWSSPSDASAVAGAKP
jgi:hypothetical protein